MANYTWSDCQEDLRGLLHGTELNKIKNLTRAAWRAGRNLLAKVNPAETRQIVQITLYDGVYDYALESDFKQMVDLRPQVSRQLSDNFAQKRSEDFDLNKALKNNLIQIKDDGGTKSLRVAKTLTPSKTVVEELDATTGWAVVGDATNLTADSLDYVSGGASLNFDLNASGSAGGIEKSTISPAVDLTDHDEKSSLFAWVYLPDISIITNVILRWGNDTSNYWSRTVTAAHNESAFHNGWNLLRFDWNGATETGTVAPASIDYLRITVTYNGTAETDIRVDHIFSSLGKIWEIEYYSNAIFRATGGTFKSQPTLDTDILNLAEDSYNIFLFELAFFLAQQLQGEDSSFDAKFFKEELHGDGRRKPGLYALYEQNHPDERMEITDSYYTIR